MRLGEVERLRGELSGFVADAFASAPRRDQRRWGACCLRGLMLDGRCTSIQPMAVRPPDGNMQALQQFVNQMPWDRLPVRGRIAQRLSEATTPEVWVVDDVSFPKCGKASVGGPASTAERSANGRTARSRSASMPPPTPPRARWSVSCICRVSGRTSRTGAAGPESPTTWCTGRSGVWRSASWTPRPVAAEGAGRGRRRRLRRQHPVPVLGLEERGLSYVLALTGKEVAHPEAVGRRPAHPDTPGRMAGRAGRSDGLLDIEPARHHPGR